MDLCLTEDDIPGSSFGGRKPSELNNDALKFWVKCRGDRCKGVKTKGPIVNYVPGDGGGFEGGGGGTILKQAPFWGVNFLLVRNMRGGQIL